MARLVFRTSNLCSRSLLWVQITGRMKLDETEQLQACVPAELHILALLSAECFRMLKSPRSPVTSSLSVCSTRVWRQSCEGLTQIYTPTPHISKNRSFNCRTHVHRHKEGVVTCSSLFERQGTPGQVSRPAQEKCIKMTKERDWRKNIALPKQCPERVNVASLSFCSRSVHESITLFINTDFMDILFGITILFGL